MKLKPLIEKIGFSKHLSKGVEDVAADKFEDFGVTVGQLYQTFLKKDLTADPAIAQKIMDMVDTDDDAVLANQIKDLEFLINQLPDKLEKKDKIGFREITYRPKGEDPDKGAELKTNKIKLKDLTPESYHPINSPIDLIDKDILDIPDGSVGEIKRAAAKLGIDPQNKYESELRDEIEDLLTSRMSTYEEYELVKKYFGDYADELIQDYGLKIDEVNEYYEKASDLNRKDIEHKLEILLDKTPPSPKNIEERQGIKAALNSNNVVMMKKALDHWSNKLGIEEMTNDEFKKAKEADRLEKHPERDKIKKIQQLIKKQIKELWLKK